MNTIKSNNQFIELLISGEYYPFFCCKDFTYAQSQEVVEVTSVNSGAAREYQSGMTTGTLDINGVSVLDNSDGKISIFYLMQQSIRRVAQTLRIRNLDDDGNAYQIVFNALITGNTLSRSRGTYSQSATQLIVTGEPTFSGIVPPPAGFEVQEPLYLTFTTGATSVTDALLAQPGVTILEVQREGFGQDQTTGTPGNRQFAFNAGTGTISFDPTNPSNGETVYVLYEL